MNMLPLAQEVLRRCDELALISQNPNFIDRRYLSAEHKKANQLVAQWMSEAGMQTWQDEAGNQWGRYACPNPHAKTLIVGSHLDTVPNSGKYDGILGVLLPLAAIQSLHQRNDVLPFHLELVGFADEEGTRFGTTLLGSRAVSGQWQDKWACLQDENGISVSQAMRDFGLDINRIHCASRVQDDLMGFLEVHIEQGPVLESQELPLGIVDGIAGARRFEVKVTGQAGHSGTVPMDMRQDSLCGAAEMITMIERLAKQNQVMATVGKIQCSPNAVNVIAGRTEFSIDIRSLNDDLRDHTLRQIQRHIEEIAQQRQLKVELKQTHEAPAVRCDQTMIERLECAFRRTGVAPYLLPSGAGHDAMAMADICPTGMIFMRCRGGISHHPAESVQLQDVLTGLQVVSAFFDHTALVDSGSMVA